MNVQQLRPGQRYSFNDSVVLPMGHIPLFRSQIAIQNKVEKNLIFRTWGGIGDQICAEPTLRFALSKFKDCKISLASECPELFSHLKFDRVFNLKEEIPVYDNYFVFETIQPPDDSNLVWQFFSHLLVNCVDFPSLCALRTQLAVTDKEVKLPDIGYVSPIPLANKAIIHAGSHWQSKTFPKQWWDTVLYEIQALNITPVLIGAKADDNRGTVDVDTDDCIDLRDKLSLLESISLLKQSKVLFTNDSSPLHMAVDSDCHIGYVATCKHPDMITHWRRGEWGWRMKNLGKGGIWDELDYCPNKPQRVEVENVPPEMLESWLPEPQEVAQWIYSRLS